MKKIKKYLKKNKYIMSIYHSLTADHFPSLNFYSIGQPTKILDGVVYPVLNPLERIIDYVRTKFWISIAKNSKKTKIGYSEFPKTSKVDSLYQKLFEDGYIIIENHLNDEDHSSLTTLCKKIPVTDKSNNTIEDYLTIRHDALASSLRGITNMLLAPDLDARLQFSYIRSNDGNDVYMPGFNTWHCDRFIPYIKALYFPFGCDWMPFERLKISSKRFQESWPVEKQKKHYFELPNELRDVPIHQFYLKPNSVVIGFNNILHRRSPITSPGERTVIYMDWTEAYSYGNIIKGLF